MPAVLSHALPLCLFFSFAFFQLHMRLIVQVSVFKLCIVVGLHVLSAHWTPSERWVFCVQDSRAEG